MICRALQRYFLSSLICKHWGLQNNRGSKLGWEKLVGYDHASESGAVLFELLIAMTLIVGSITVAHTVYLQLVHKKVELEKSHEAWVFQKNQHEIAIYLKHRLIHTDQLTTSANRLQQFNKAVSQSKQ